MCTAPSTAIFFVRYTLYPGSLRDLLLTFFQALVWLLTDSECRRRRGEAASAGWSRSMPSGRWLPVQSYNIIERHIPGERTALHLSWFKKLLARVGTCWMFSHVSRRTLLSMNTPVNGRHTLPLKNTVRSRREERVWCEAAQAPSIH